MVLAPADKQREAKRAWAAKTAAAGRDIGGIPEIANVDRRESCRRDFRLYCETYERSSFYMGWSPDHLAAIARIQEAVLYGALYAFAMPRGSGKTTLCRAAVRWASAYAHRRYVFLIGANLGKAQDSLEAAKTVFRFSQDFAEDFPEISYPAIQLGGIANRASGQLCDGVSTMIEWAKDRIVLPTVPMPANHPEYAEGVRSPTSGIVIGASGLTGDGIRGSVYTTASGESVRPDFILLDDPQTDESAGSATQNASRYRLLTGAVLGMAGPDKSIAGVMPCTVIRKGDMVDSVLDRKKNPIWRGDRTQMVPEMPIDMDAWEAYREVYERGVLKEPPDQTEANAYYKANREALDKGSRVSWTERKEKRDVSAIQHAMHLYFRDPGVFWAEYQNEPLEDTAIELMATPDVVRSRMNGYERNAIPSDAERITAFIDVQDKLLWYCVCAWAEDFTGYVVDYGAFPDQGRRYFTLRDASRSLSAKYSGAGLEGGWIQGVRDLSGEITRREYKRTDGLVLRASQVLVDSAYGSSRSTIHSACEQFGGDGLVLPSYGVFIGATTKPFNDRKPQKGDRFGFNWRLSRIPDNPKRRRAAYDANFWKSFVHERMMFPTGDRGGLTVFKAPPGDHDMFADQFCAERPVKVEAKGRSVIQWGADPSSPDNHYLDCVAGCAVAASISGVTVDGHTSGKRKRKGKSVKLSDLQRERGAA